jgi:hypothetical protein
MSERISYNDMAITSLPGGVANRLPLWQRLTKFYVSGVSLSMNTYAYFVKLTVIASKFST